MLRLEMGAYVNCISAAHAAVSTVCAGTEAFGVALAVDDIVPSAHAAGDDAQVSFGWRPSG